MHKDSQVEIVVEYFATRIVEKSNRIQRFEEIDRQ